jgi:hypothetical protein
LVVVSVFRERSKFDVKEQVEAEGQVKEVRGSTFKKLRDQRES